MIKGSTLVKDLTGGVIRLSQRRGSTEFQKLIPQKRRNSICGPCNGGGDHNNAYYHSSSSSIKQQTNYDHLQQSYPQTSIFSTIVENGSTLVQEYIPNSNPNLNNNSRRNSSDFPFQASKSILEELNRERRHSFDTINDGIKTIFENRIENEIDIEANRTFTSVWMDFISKYGLENLRFPKEILWLGGAPGAGKGTNTKVFMNSLGVESEPIVVSSLLNSKECNEIKKNGGLVNDRVVLEMLLRELGRPDFTGSNRDKSRVIVDGFPRTAIQVKFVELLHNKLKTLRSITNPEAAGPVFRVAVLHVSEEESVARQLDRGVHTKNQNEIRKQQGLPLLELRETDIDPIASKKRYSIYKQQYDNLKSLSKTFTFNEIDANGSMNQVENLIKETYKGIRP
eukprot:gene8260-10150_t